MSCASLQTITSFPSHVRIWAHPGVTCTIQTAKDEEESIIRTDAILRKMLREGAKEPFEVLAKIVADEEIKKIFYSTEVIDFGCFYRDHLCHNEALDYIEKVGPFNFKTGAFKAFITYLNTIHSKVVSELDASKPSRGELRTQKPIMCVAQNSVLEQSENFIQYLKVHDPEALTPDLTNVGQIMSQGITLEEVEAKQLASEKTIKTLRKYYDFCPPSEQVPKLMQELFSRLQSNGKEQDAISLACEAHIAMVRIHPYADANGRMARIVMNLLLMEAGHQPIAFVFDSLYSEATRQEIKGKKGTFEKFVRHLVAQFDYEALPFDKIDPELIKIYNIQLVWQEFKKN